MVHLKITGILKTLLIIVVLTISNTLPAQNITKFNIQKCYAEGMQVVDYINDQDSSSLRKLYDDISIDRLFRITKNSKNDERTDLYYDYRKKQFVFTIYSGKMIDNGTDWGLFNYYFITQLRLINENEKFRIIQTLIIFDDIQQKKIWWQSFMDSYNDKNYKRKEWADNFKLVPPPPPAPESTEWFKKE